MRLNCWLQNELTARHLQCEHSADPAIRRFAQRRASALSGALAWQQATQDNNAKVNRREAVET